MSNPYAKPEQGPIQDLHPFGTFKRDCPKCGDHHTSFAPKRTYCAGCGMNRVEHLHITCRGCGFELLTRTQDAAQ